MSWYTRLAWMFGRRRRSDDDIDEEIRFHLETETAERISDGVSAAEAEQAARRAFGNVSQVKELTRTMWGWASMERIVRDVRYALRALRRTPAFTVTAMISIALGIGANVASFSMADAFLFRPLPIHQPDEVLAINGQTAHNLVEGVSYPDLQDLRTRNRSFSSMAGYTLARFAFSPAPDLVPQMRMGMEVTQSFFTVLGIQPSLGRAFLDEECSVPGRDAVVILGYDFWKQQFAGDEAVVGRTVLLNGVSFNVVGVMPESFTGMDPLIRPAVYLPVTMVERLHAASGKRLLESREHRSLNLRARLKPGVGLEGAQSELSALSNALAQEFPEADRDRVLQARSELQLRIQQSPPTATTVVLLMVLAVMVLAIACSNVASLMLARARARSREVAIRTAIGAGSGQLVQQLLTESVVVALCGGMAGLALAYTSIRYLASIRIPTDTPMTIATQLDARVLVFALIASVVSALLFGLAPALRSVKPDLVSALKAGDLEAQGRMRTIGRSVLVASQVALSLVLLVVSVTLLDAFRRMLILDPGIRTDHIMMFEFDPSLVGYSAEQTGVFYKQVVDQTRGLPGVRSATLSRAVPFRPNFTEMQLVPEGFELPRNQRSVSISTNTVDDRYFETMRTAIVQGRAFTEQDTGASRRVAVVNQEFVNRYWNGQDAIGKRFRLGESGPMVEVVGVAKTGKYLSLAETPQPYVYLPFGQQPLTRMTMLVHTVGAPGAMTDPVLRIVRGLDAKQPVYNVRPFDVYFEQGVLGPALVVMQMVGSTGIVGLALALVGLYGLVAYSVARRTREIGIRMAIGASRWMVLRLVLAQGLRLSLIGVGVGVALSLPVFRLMAAKLAGLGTLSPVTLVLVPCGLVLITLCACSIPAYRASRVDPTCTLRYE